MATPKPSLKVALYWRGKSAWIRWTQPGEGQQRRPLGKLTEDEAEKKRRDKEATLHRHSVPFFEDYTLDTYQPWHEVEYPSTYSRVEGIIRNHLTPAFGHLQLDQFRAETVEKFKHKRLGSIYRGKPVKPKTVAKEMRTLLAVLEHAVTWHYLDKHPIKGQILMPQDFESTPPPYYSIEQLRDLFRSKNKLGELSDWIPVWKFMVNTGIRLAEMLKAHSMDIRERPDGPAIYIESIPTARTKSKKWRFVPLSDAARDALESLPLNDYLCPQVRRESMGRAFKRDAERVGLPGTLHWLRHTYCSHMAMSGKPFDDIRILAGHSSSSVTEQYIHLKPGFMAGKFVNLE